MENWKQRFPGTKTLEKAIEKSSGHPAQDLIKPEGHPFLKSLNEAVLFFQEHKDGPVTIIGDYDVDGVTSSAILYMGIKKYTGNAPRVRLPRRFSEGYGLSMKIIDEISEGLVITVDNGITAVEQVKAAKEKGLSAIVIDHHLGSRKLPCADVILDPKAIKGSGFEDYCGAGLAYRFIETLLPDDPLLDKLAAFAGIGTVADVMPLIGDNRNLVRKSLAMVREKNVTEGLAALLASAGIREVTADTYGYQVGPIINASGRLYDDGAMKGFNLLIRDPEFRSAEIDPECMEAAKEMVAANEERKKLVEESLGRAAEAFSGREVTAPAILYDPECSEGIIGIVAGQLVEEYHMPAIVFTDSSKEKVLKGSGRSVPDVHLKELLDRASEWLLGYGGHAGAAGLSLKKDDLGDFKKALREELKDFRPSAGGNFYDLALRPEQVPGMIRELKKYEPFGEGVPEPVFLVEGFRCQAGKDGEHYQVLGHGKEHIKLPGDWFHMIGFFKAEEYKALGSPETIDAICRLGQDSYKGKTQARAEIIDFGIHKGKTGKMSLEEFLKE